MEGNRSVYFIIGYYNDTEWIDKIIIKKTCEIVILYIVKK